MKAKKQICDKCNGEMTLVKAIYSTLIDDRMKAIFVCECCCEYKEKVLREQK